MIDLTQIPSDGLHLNGVFAAINVNDNSQLDQVVWKFSIIPSSKVEFFIDINGTASLIDRCSRCLDKVKKDLVISSKFFISKDSNLKVGGTHNLNRQDLDVVFTAEQFINEENIVIEQFQLNIPNCILCSNTCNGLCANCGTNLNNDTCICQTNSPHTNEKPNNALFKALNGLKLNFNNSNEGNVR